jgi:uncharacterized protein
MPIKENREYRIFQSFEPMPQEPEGRKYRIAGRAVAYATPTVLAVIDGIEYREQIDPAAFAETDLSDVIFNYNHGGKVVARNRNKTLVLRNEPDGLYMEADLGGTEEGRRLYEEIEGGYIDRMSFSFARDYDYTYDEKSHTVTITNVKKLFDVSAVDIPCYNETSLSVKRSAEEAYSADCRALEQARRRKKLIAQTLL